MSSSSEEPTEEEMSEVLCAYGRAVYEAAGVELCIAQLLAIAKISSQSQQNRTDARNEFQGRRQHTLGRLMKAVRESVELPPEVTEMFDQALAGRNWLIHHFFFESFPALARSRTRNALMRQLSDMAQWFSNLDRLLIKQIDRNLALKGVSLDNIRSTTELYLSALDSGDNNTH